MTAPAKRSPVRYFVLLLDALRRQGVETAQLLRKAGFEETRFDRRKMPLLPAEIEAFVASARQLTGRTDLGFEMGSLIKMNSHDLLGYGMWSCRNFDEVMWMVSRHFHLMTETFTMTYRRTRSHGEAVYTPVTSFAPETLRFMNEVMATSHGNQVRLTFGQDTPVYDIHLSMPEPSHIARYRALAPARFHFGERGLGGVRVVMGADLLDKALPMADPHVVKEVDERCGIVGQRPPPGDPGWGDYVTMMLRDDLGELVTLDDLARRINLSARTVDRLLKKENLTLRDIPQKVRFERACELLADPAATVVQVALGVGFTDPASFSRAFRRVVGVSPGQFQQRLSSARPPGRWPGAHGRAPAPCALHTETRANRYVRPRFSGWRPGTQAGRRAAFQCAHPVLAGRSARTRFGGSAWAMGLPWVWWLSGYIFGSISRVYPVANGTISLSCGQPGS